MELGNQGGTANNLSSLVISAGAKGFFVGGNNENFIRIE